MYSPWYYGMRYPPTNPYITTLVAQRVAEAAQRQNFLLNKQVLQLTRENVDLRTKIVKMNAQKLSNYDSKHIGYSKQALEGARTIQKRREVKQQLYPNRTQIKSQIINRSYSFGNLKNDKNQKILNTITKTTDNRRHKTLYQVTPKNQQSNGKQRRFKYTEDDRSSINQKGTNTFIQRLYQSKMNPQKQTSKKNIIRIQSQSYPEQNHQNQKEKYIKKDNKVYLNEQKQQVINSPIAKLKSIKKFNESQIPSSRKSIGKKQYLSLIGNIFESVRNQNKPTENTQEKKPLEQIQKQKQ